MLEQRKQKVLAAYQQLEKSEKLSVNLLHPTTANLRNECIITFQERPNEKIKTNLQALAGLTNQILIAEDIRNIDPDKFRPLRKFILGEIENPNAQTVALLAWLIDYKKQELTPLPSFLKDVNDNRWIYVGLAVTFILIAFYCLRPTKQCMYWDGKVYQEIHCDEGAASDLNIVKLDQKKLTSFKRITKKDTIHYKDVGRIWYMKINNQHEFYTAKGMHPVEVKKQLKPITKFIIDEHILKLKDK